MMDTRPAGMLTHIWDRSEGRYVFLPQAVYRGIWWEGQPLLPVSALIEYDQLPNYDSYFSVLTFDGDARTQDNVSGTVGVMWLDLDYIPQNQRPVSYLSDNDAFPNYLWSTSPGHYQAVYFIEPLYVADWKRHAKAFTDRISGADPGGWHPTKVLRVPGSVNYKRGGETGEVVHIDHRTVQPAENLSKLVTGGGSLAHPEVELMPGAISDDQRLRLLVREWQRLPLGVQHWLTLSEDQYPFFAPKDRSLLIRGLLLQIKGAGIDALTSFHLISGRPFDKFRDRPQDLWQEVLKAYRA